MAKFFAVLLDVMSQQRLFVRGVATVLGVVFVLGALMVRLLRAHQWTGAAICFLIMMAPFVVGAWLWRRNHQAALDEAQQARSPLNLP
jgi:hypothetical protein